MEIKISIHALREEGDPTAGGRSGWTGISIHALREEGDIRQLNKLQAAVNFYPRPPRGGRRTAPRPVRWWQRISIHALREEGDLRWP